MRLTMIKFRRRSDICEILSNCRTKTKREIKPFLKVVIARKCMINPVEPEIMKTSRINSDSFGSFGTRILYLVTTHSCESWISSNERIARRRDVGKCVHAQNVRFACITSEETLQKLIGNWKGGLGKDRESRERKIMEKVIAGEYRGRLWNCNYGV